MNNWASTDEIKQGLNEVNIDGEINQSGIPLYTDGKKSYITNNFHNVVIGSKDSNKASSIIIPLVKNIIRANESLLITDENGVVFSQVSEDAKNNGYNVIKVNINDSNTQKFNPLLFPYHLFMNNNKDKAYEVLNTLANHIFPTEGEGDPFWNLMSSKLFVCVAVYLYKTENIENITLFNIYNIVKGFNVTRDKIKDTLRGEDIYMSYENVYHLPSETLLGVTTMFNRNMEPFILSGIRNITETSDFDIINIQKDKTAIFIIDVAEGVGRDIVSILIEQIYSSISINTYVDKLFNMIIDNFTNIVKINDMVLKLYHGSNKSIRFTLGINSMSEVNNVYGPIDGNAIIYNCLNMIYLKSNDLETMEAVIKSCGNDKNNKPLLTMTDLRKMNNEGIAFISSSLPIRFKY